MFDATRSPQKLMDTSEMERQLSLVIDPAIREMLVQAWVDRQNRKEQKSFEAVLPANSYASIIGLGLTEPLTTSEFADLIGTLLQRPYGRKLIMNGDLPCVSTLFDVNGFNTQITELERYTPKLVLTAQTKLVKSEPVFPNSVENES